MMNDDYDEFVSSFLTHVLKQMTAYDLIVTGSEHQVLTYSRQHRYTYLQQSKKNSYYKQKVIHGRILPTAYTARVRDALI